MNLVTLGLNGVEAAGVIPHTPSNVAAFATNTMATDGTVSAPSYTFHHCSKRMMLITGVISGHDLGQLRNLANPKLYSSVIVLRLCRCDRRDSSWATRLLHHHCHVLRHQQQKNRLADF